MATFNALVMSFRDGNSHPISSTGFMGRLQVYGDATTTLTMQGDGALSEDLRFGEGNDQITTGGGGTGFVSMGDPAHDNAAITLALSGWPHGRL
jgi:hypothetical protein